MEWNIGANIIAEREKRNITQKELADAIGITNGRLYNYEKGKTEPPAGILLDIAYVFNITVEELITGKSNLRNLKPDEKNLIETYQQLDDIQKGRLLERATILRESASV